MLEPIRRLMKGPLCGMTGNLNPEGAEFPQGNYFRPENIPQPEKIFDNSQQKIFELMRNYGTTRPALTQEGLFMR